MKQLTVGDVTITNIIERDGPWRKPEDMFVGYDPEVGKRHLASMDSEVFDWTSGRMVITYQTFLVRTPKHTILVDTCTGEDKGHPPPFDFPGKERWRDELFALGVSYEQIDYVFCTHLHIDHTGWNTTLRNERWVPTFPNAKYIFHKREYAAWEAEHARGANPPGTVFRDNCLPIVEAGQALLVAAEADKHRPMLGGRPERGIAAEDMLFYPILFDHRARHMRLRTADLLS